MFKKLSALFKSNTSEEDVQVEKTMRTLKEKDLINFDFGTVPEVSNQRCTITGRSVAKLQKGSPITFFKLSSNTFIREYNLEQFEIMRPVDIQLFIDNVNEEFDAFNDIDDDEFEIINGKEVLNSNDMSFSILSDFDPMLPASKYYAVVDQLECTFASESCRFSRLSTLDKKHWLTIITKESGDTEIYASSLLDNHNIKSIL